MTEFETYLHFPLLSGDPRIRHLFTTRSGGVSQGMYQSMNLGFQRGDDPACVKENYARVAAALSCEPEAFLCTKQTHTTNIQRITQKPDGRTTDHPYGFLGHVVKEETDGLVTNVPGVVLVAFVADCVPLYFWDPAHQAIGLAHSGWRGTAGCMGERMVQRMEREFGTHPHQLRAVVGPSICADCYEVSEDVAQAVSAAAGTETVIRRNNTKEDDRGNTQPKFLLDLWEANYRILRNAGLLEENIEVAGLCTCHNPTELFSHRATQGKRGVMGAFLGII